ncbi:MAG: lycopene cyclase domain-containing protein [Fibrobacteria bacterium]
MKTTWVYLALMAGTLSFPLLFSFSRRFGFGPRWKAAWAAVAMSALPFLAWDVLFTRWGVWGFNPAYILGFSLFGLPLEEVLFFFCIPFANLFIYQALARSPLLLRPPAAVRWAWGIAAALLLGAGIFQIQHAYTCTVCLLACAASACLCWRNPPWSALLLAATAMQYFPFLLVNGLLTGLPVVMYRASALNGFRIGTIPAEDFAYSFILLALNVAIYEKLTRDGNLTRAKPVRSPDAA